MEIFHRILKAAIDGGASDVHLKVGGPVILRLNRQLISIEAPVPTREWMENILTHILPHHLKPFFDEDREADFSYFAPGIGRFRTNVFQQRGDMCLAMRYVKTMVPDFAALGLPVVLKDIAESPRGIVLLAGATGCGKSTTLAAMIEHINGYARKHVVRLDDTTD